MRAQQIKLHNAIEHLRVAADELATAAALETDYGYRSDFKDVVDEIKAVLKSTKSLESQFTPLMFAKQ